MTLRTCMSVVMVVVGALAASIAPLSGQKPGTTSPNWPATATFRSASDDAVSNDLFTATGKAVPYVHGQEGLTCVVVPDHPSLQTSGDFSLYWNKGKSPRSIFYAAQSGSIDGYPGFDASYSQSQIRVRDIVSVLPGGSDLRTVVVWAYGRMLGDGGSELPPPAAVTVDQALVTRTADCTWTITVGKDSDGYPVGAGGHLSRWTGPNKDRYAGTFAMPFEITVTADPAPTTYGSCRSAQ